ncbi:Fic family protein [Demequina capsici]|uniref:Fic family protein n=1 Tax=Demequina capsici TaxID=3075620 RepID=A0AA96JA73_9MICO|nr:Fic family protein [Demequina sp. PMTSA13]WNM27135.1 Fic family protein [Demequina sp. PMTSA13]
MLTEITVEIPAHIAQQPVTLPTSLTAELEHAVAAIARIESRSEHLGGLGELLVRSEAVASSKIEHVYSTLDDIARASVDADAAAGARSTVAASRALTALTDSCAHAPLTHDAILEAHQRLLDGDLREAQFAGKYRPMQNWIGGSDLAPRDAANVRPLMDDLLAFHSRTDMPAVAQAAITHGQFESIHPFTDGNGRIGRALIGATYRRRGLTVSATVPVAAAMLADTDMYFTHLASYRAGDPEPLVRYVAQCTSTAAEAALESADHLAAMPAAWHEKITARQGSASRTLVDGLLSSPVLDIGRAEKVARASHRRAYEALDHLTDAGVLEEITGSARSRVWVASDVMDELGELEDRIGHRSMPSTEWR